MNLVPICYIRKQDTQMHLANRKRTKLIIIILKFKHIRKIYRYLKSNIFDKI